MRHNMLSFLATVFVLAVMPSTGLSQQSTNVVVFDFMRTIEVSKAGQAAASQLKLKEQTIASELEKIDRQILAFQQRLNTQRLTLNAAALQDLTKKIDDLQIEKKRTGEDLTKEYQKLQYDLVEKMKQDVLTVVGEIAKEKKYQLVLEISSGGIAYFEENFDITVEVIRRYDASGSGR